MSQQDGDALKTADRRGSDGGHVRQPRRHHDGGRRGQGLQRRGDAARHAEERRDGDLGRPPRRPLPRRPRRHRCGRRHLGRREGHEDESLPAAPHYRLHVRHGRGVRLHELLVRLEHRRLALHHAAPSRLGGQDRRHVEHRAHGSRGRPGRLQHIAGARAVARQGLQRQSVAGPQRLRDRDPAEHLAERLELHGVRRAELRDLRRRPRLRRDVPQHLREPGQGRLGPDSQDQQAVPAAQPLHRPQAAALRPRRACR